MYNYSNNCQQTGQSQSYNNHISSNSIDIHLDPCGASEIRADVMVDAAPNCVGARSIVRLWGQVRDCSNAPVANALLKLVKVVTLYSGIQYEGIAHTVSDCEGFYQFDLCYNDGAECYKVLVNKTYSGPEQVITGNGACNSCNSCTQQPCQCQQQPCQSQQQPCQYQQPCPYQQPCGENPYPCQPCTHLPSPCNK